MGTALRGLGGNAAMRPDDIEAVGMRLRVITARPMTRNSRTQRRLRKRHYYDRWYGIVDPMHGDGGST